MDKKQTDKKRINLFMPSYMVDELDCYAEQLGANRTSLINMICKQYLDQQDVVKMSKMIDHFDKKQIEGDEK